MTPVVPHVAQSSPTAPCAATPSPAMLRTALESPAAPRVATVPHVATDGPPPHEWPSSLIVYAKQLRQLALTAPWVLLRHRLIDDLLRLYL
jgi:hypothetical protein